MSDPTPSPASAEIAALTSSVKCLRRLTYISLGFNVFFLLLIVVGIICHHHRHHHHHHGFGQGGGRGGQCQGMHRGGPGGMGFHRWGGGFGPGQGGWGNRGGWGGDQGGPGGFDHGPGNKGDDGMHKMMGPGGTPPDPAALTYLALAQLTQKLKLTDDEQAKLKPIVQAQITAIMKQMDDGKSQVRAVLTPDQQKQFDALPFMGNKSAAPAATTTNSSDAGK